MGRPELEQRALHAILLVATLVRVLGRHAFDDGAIAMVVWNGLALLRLVRIVRIPRAIVWRGGGRRHWRLMLPRLLVPPVRNPNPDLVEIGQWRPLEPYVLDSRRWI